MIVRFCDALECQPGDLIVLVEENKPASKKKAKARG
jgi:DNA-binding Xre family transcriptional regulator